MKKVLIIVLLIAVLGLASFIIFDYDKGTSCAQGQLSQQDAVNKALDHINKYLLTGGTKASLVQIYENQESLPYYQFQIDLQGQKYDSIVTADGSRLFTDGGIDLNAKQDEQAENGFYIRNDAEIITENEKPVIHLFTSSTCPHCSWQKPIMQTIVEGFGDLIVYKQIEDSAEDQEVYLSFFKGGVPAVLIGGKYYREGAGEIYGEDADKEAITKYICELTNGQPESICKNMSYEVIKEKDISYAGCKRVGIYITVPDNTSSENVSRISKDIINQKKNEWDDVTVWAYKESEKNDIEKVEATMGTETYSICQ